MTPASHERPPQHRAEDRGLFEGVFGRAFRTHVQPVELARKLAKEMDEHRTVSVSRVYVPNEYTVYLSPDDREQFAGYEARWSASCRTTSPSTRAARATRCSTPPQVLLETDDDLAIGEFGIATRMVQPESGADRSRPSPRAGRAGRDDDLPGRSRRSRRRRPPRRARARARGRRARCRRTAAHALDERDASCSGARRSATSRSRTRTSRAGTPRCARRAPRTGSSTSDSTNGIEVNGRRVKRAKLERRRPHHARLDRPRLRPRSA